MADSYKDILITPNRSNTADPKIEFRGGNSSVNTSISLFTYPTSNGTLSFEGSAGQLFSITNDLSGSIFSVNDISGIPSIELFANGVVSFAQYGGNVGIGTTSPAEKLHIAGGNIQLENALELRSKDTGGTIRTITRVNSSDELEYGWSGNGPVKFMGGGSYTERIRIHTDGNVGIGTTSPAAALDVNGKAIFRVSDDSASSGGFTITNDGTQPTVQSWGFNSNPVFLVTSETVAAPHIAAHQVSTDTNGAVIRGYKGRGTSTTNSSVANGDEILRIDAWPLHTAGPNIYKFGGGMIWYKDDNGGTASTYAPVSLKWIMSNSITTTIDAMTLLYNGNLTIAGTLTQSSSAALKENINPISNALDLITNLTGVTYNRKDGSAINCPGFIAEEVDKVLPNVVQKDKEGNPSGIQYTNLIAYLVESIKELKAEIDILKGR